ncbi:hypothetical protein PTKIN_Ptkin19aG0032900 [Pterospermum kingtungense]
MTTIATPSLASFLIGSILSLKISPKATPNQLSPTQKVRTFWIFLKLFVIS